MQRRYKVLIIGTLPPHLGSKNYGGVARVVWGLAKSLRDAGENFALAAIGRYYGGNKIVEGIPIYGRDPLTNSKQALQAILDTIRAMVKHRRRFREKSIKAGFRLVDALYLLAYLSRIARFDCIHVHHVTNQIPLAVRLLRLNVRVIVTVHSCTQAITAKSTAQRKAAVDDIVEQLACADGVTWVSQSVRRQALELGIRWKCEDTVIYNGVDLPELDFSKEPQKRNQLCFVGALIETKGVLRLLEALDELAAPVEHVLWMGRGKLKAAVKKRLRTSPTHATLLDFVERDQALLHMAASGVLVAPSVSESFGLASIEALFVGTPVIGFHQTIAELREILACTERESQWLTPYNHETESASDLAQKIELSLKIKRRDAYQREWISIRGKLKDRFGWENVRADYMKLYRGNAEGRMQNESQGG